MQTAAALQFYFMLIASKVGRLEVIAPEGSTGRSNGA